MQLQDYCHQVEVLEVLLLLVLLVEASELTPLLLHLMCQLSAAVGG